MDTPEPIARHTSCTFSCGTIYKTAGYKDAETAYNLCLAIYIEALKKEEDLSHGPGSKIFTITANLIAAKQFFKSLGGEC
jgi:hypothetical protein